MYEYLVVIMYTFQIAALIAAILVYNNYKHSPQKYFLHFLTYSVLNDLSGFLLIHFFKVKSDFLYNTYILIAFLFYLYWYNKIFKKKKKLVMPILVIVLAFFSESVFDRLNDTLIIVGSSITLLFTILYFVDLLKRDDVENYLIKQEFWIATGLLIFYLGNLPISIFGFFYDDYSITMLQFIGRFILNVLMYSCFVISFICLKKK